MTNMSPFKTLFSFKDHSKITSRASENVLNDPHQYQRNYRVQRYQQSIQYHMSSQKNRQNLCNDYWANMQMFLGLDYGLYNGSTYANAQVKMDYQWVQYFVSYKFNFSLIHFAWISFPEIDPAHDGNLKINLPILPGICHKG